MKQVLPAQEPPDFPEAIVVKARKDFWLCAFCQVIVGFFASPVDLCIAFYAGLILRKRLGARAFALLLLSPTIWVTSKASFDAVQDYRAGTGRIYRFGYTEFRLGVDPDYRCWQMNGGCTLSGPTAMYGVPYNLALKKLIGRFGPMPGSYLGPIPEAEEARRLIAEEAISLPLFSSKDPQDRSLPLPGLALHGFSRDELIERFWNHVSFPEDREQFIASLARESIAPPRLRVAFIDDVAALVQVDKKTIPETIDDLPYAFEYPYTILLSSRHREAVRTYRSR